MQKTYFILLALFLLLSNSVSALTFDESGKAVVSFSDLTATGGLTFNQTTGELTNDGTGGKLSVTLPESGIDMSAVTAITVTYTGDNTILSYLHIENADGTKVNDWYNSRYSVSFKNYASTANSVSKIVWNGSKTAGTMTIQSIVIQKTVTSSDGSIALTKDMFHVWTDATASATVTEGTITFTDGLNKELSKGATVYGNASVNYLQYADLTSYDKIVIKGTSGQTVRSLFNRLTDGGTDYKEIKSTFDENGEATINLKADVSDSFVHLNAIKVSNTATATVTITSISLYKTSTSSISDISFDSKKRYNKVYNLNGQQVKLDSLHSYDNLHGLYIVNGKKVIFK
jgi:hypothetical protein